MLETGELSTWRSNVIERAINAEWLASAIITQHYFKRVYLPFLLEVLYDEQFSYSLKRRVLEKIVDHPDLKARICDFNRMGTIRNFFAHCGQEIVTAATGDAFVPNPRRPGEPIDFGALYDEFLDTAPRVEGFLTEVFLAMGGQVSDEPPRPA